VTSRKSRVREPHSNEEPPVSQVWQAQVAKAKFSEVFRRAREHAPQVVTRQGKEAVVIVALEEFEQLTRRASQPRSLSKFFAESPLARASINFEREPDYGRTVKL
jgi:antitoxin Phd